MTQQVGIAEVGVKLPSKYIRAEELAELRGIDPKKFTVGLGCSEVALCAEGETAVTLAAQAAERALSRWSGNRDDIGLLVVGTETAADMSRPLSAFVAESLGLRGAIRSYEVKHACYGGTLGLRQALEWRLSGAARGKAALVIATDVALYAPKDPGEPTQGAGAVAMIVDEPNVASVDLQSFSWSEPVFDFWRPVGEAFPRVDGPLSLDCYKRAALETFRQLAAHEGQDLKTVLQTLSASCFHVPFPKMVKKAVVHLGESEGWGEAETAAIFENKVIPTMRWNRRVGNCYTASLWLSVASTLAQRQAGDRIAAFSYGSGFGAELLTLQAGSAVKNAGWVEDFDADARQREAITGAQYEVLRDS